MSSLDYLDLCRLCLVKDGVSVPIFEGEGDVRQIFLKIAACLPVKVAREDKLPKKICDNCVYKVELLYQFWNTTANAEKQLLQWLGEVGLEDKQGYVTGVLNTSTMKEEDDASSVIQSSIATTTPQSGIGIGVIDNIGLGMPFSGTTHQQQLPPTIPINQPIHQALPGPSNQPAPDQLSQTQGNATTRPQDEEEESSEEEDNSDDDCDADDGLPVKEESEEDLGNSRNIEPTTFVNVSLACDEAGPSGLQQQKNTTEIPELSMPQTLNESDAKSGYFVSKNHCISSSNNMMQLSQDLRGTEMISEDNGCDIMNTRQQQRVDDNVKQLYICILCDEGFDSEETLSSHIDTHDEKLFLYTCDVCGRCFKTPSILKKHHLIHTDEKTNVCDICGYASVHRSNLINHQRRHHFDYKYQCEVCNLGFYAKSNYMEHQTIHTREKPFQCQICQASFRYRQGLRLHAKLHQPDYVPPQKKHHCELCNKRFSRKQVLLVHMKTHSTNMTQSEFVCHICGKAVSSKTYLTIHVRKHTGEKPHVCDLCNKGFISQNYLSVHRRTHTGERPHQCFHCGKRFTQRTTLVVHLRGHTGDKPYPCNICHKSFASKTMLNSHLRTHAKQDARAQQEQQKINDPSTNDLLRPN
ncbi:histone-lysine N-methyltransferase PRDM9-like isoform X9 [Athalia rosae]|uniref:histone-lysine N-methyltransferase PRDM9-like isoform X9 n=1 Tax=Athalia rosae TaxID=37344 RepID=UPI0020338A33|nr:histone-lysine N-methyltransferase PRDM9-like isoform X9 [Athalia rosae]